VSAIARIERLLIATKNKGKVAEFQQLLGDARVSLDDLSVVTGSPDVDEIGVTFADNACLKASEYARHFKTWALADDSGLAVDALRGKPGIHSARWAQLHAAGSGDADNNRLLLKQLESIPDEQRTARFVCALALSDPGGRVVLTTSDTVEGRVIREHKGAGGFGYDPLFHIDALGKTTAELSSQEKHAISHRGKAMRHMVRLMREAGLV
jgi:XTP/dITP diphosphohydrolase